MPANGQPIKPAHRPPSMGGYPLRLQTHSVLPAIPMPTYEEQRSLFYRRVKQSIGNHNGLEFWMRGDNQAGSISVVLFASGGAQLGGPSVHGSGADFEPLWPAWTSQPISTDFSGWKRVIVRLSDMTYRSPIGAAPGDQSGDILTSADAFGISSPNRSGVIYINSILWTTLDDSGSPTGDTSVIDDFSDADLAAWQLKGSPEAVSNFVPGITSDQQFVKDGTTSLKLDYSRYLTNRRALAAITAKSLAVSGHDYLVSVPTSPFNRILPDSLPMISEISSSVSLTECPEQTGCGSFALYSLHGLTNVSVHLTTDLFGIGKSIPKSNISLYVVKVWHRMGGIVTADRDSAGPTPELLVKDDRIPLAMVNGAAPDVRLDGDPITDIPAGTEKQFWIDVTVPRYTPAGQYSAEMVVRSNEEKPFTVTLSVNVLPLRLLSPSKQFVINYRGRTGESSDGTTLPLDTVSQNQMSAQLADIAAHGFHYVTLTDSPDTLSKTMATEQQFGFQVPILYPVPAGLAGVAMARSVEKLGGDQELYVYLVPTTPTLADDLAALKKAGFQTAAVISDENAYNEVQANLDVAIYSVDYPYVQQLIRNDGQRTSSTRDWLTWPSAQTDPQADRLYAGFLLWRCNLYGAFISDYQTCYSTDPYDDTLAPVEEDFAARRPAMLTYPTADGVIDTIQWESIREGINDIRYLTTFYSALRECKDARIDTLLVAKAESDVTSFLNEPFWLMSDADYQNGRLMLASYAVQFRKDLNTYYARHPGSDQ